MVDILGFIPMIDNATTTNILTPSNNWYCLAFTYHITAAANITPIAPPTIEIPVCFISIDPRCFIINTEVKKSAFKIIGPGTSSGINQYKTGTHSIPRPKPITLCKQAPMIRITYTSTKSVKLSYHLRKIGEMVTIPTHILLL